MRISELREKAGLGRRFLVNRDSVSNGFRVVLGLFLLLAALLKSHGLVAPGPESLVVTPALTVGAIELEVVLGLLLLTKVALRAAWFAAFGFFLTGTVFNAYLGASGEASCGCLGPAGRFFAISPWMVLGVDAALAVGLALWVPGTHSAESARVWLRAIVRAVIGASLIVGGVAGVFFLTVDQPAQALSLLRGDFITVEPAVARLGDGAVREQRTFMIRVTNHKSRTVRVIGATSTCSCVATDDLPVTLGPGASREIHVHATFSGRPGSFQNVFLLYTDDNDQPMVQARFTARVVEAGVP